ncbi:MAG TPA: protein-disulfide reductase DsbD family protein [Anaerolineales bacterium]|nr:protein-disulfide reductase DsbD family protein [Anaerolineales bacterium]
MSRRKWLTTCLGVFLLAVGSVLLMWQTGIFSPPRQVLLWEFTEKGVTTTVEARRSAFGRLELLATFTPTREHFHLYSKDLPRDGLNGLGRPTLLEVISSDGINSVGLLEANQPTLDLYLEILGLTFPVYPEGPVILQLPLEFTNNNHTASLEISVTYMACSDMTCLPPVVDKRFTVQLSNETFQQLGK